MKTSYKINWKQNIILGMAMLLFACNGAPKKNGTTATDSSPTKVAVQPSHYTTCAELVTALVKSSNADAIKLFGDTAVKVRLNRINSEKATIELYVNDISDASSKERAVQNTVGWLEFYPKTNRLLDITNDPENPVHLRYDKTLIRQHNLFTLCNENEVHATNNGGLNNVMLEKDIRFNGKLKRYFSLSDFEKVFGKADSIVLIRDEQPCTAIFEEGDGSKNRDDKYLYKNRSRFENHQQQVAVDEFWFVNGNFITHKGKRIDASTTMSDFIKMFPGARLGKLNEYREGKLDVIQLKEDEKNISDGHIKVFFKNGKIFFMHWWFPC